MAKFVFEGFLSVFHNFVSSKRRGTRCTFTFYGQVQKIERQTFLLLKSGVLRLFLLATPIFVFKKIPNWDFKVWRSFSEICQPLKEMQPLICEPMDSVEKNRLGELKHSCSCVSFKFFVLLRHITRKTNATHAMTLFPAQYKISIIFFTILYQLSFPVKLFL